MPAARSTRRPGTGDAADRNMAGADLDDEEHIQAAQGDGAVHVEEAACQHGRARVRRNCRQADLLRCGAGGIRRTSPRPPHRRGACPDAQAGQLALDPPVAPARILGRHSLDQHRERGSNRRPATPMGAGPPPAGQPPVPAKQHVRRDQPARPHRPGEQPGQGSQHRPITPIQPRPRGSAAAPPPPPAAAPAAPRLPDAAERANSTIHPATRTNIRYSTPTVTSPRRCQPPATTAGNPTGQRPMPRFATP